MNGGAEARTIALYPWYRFLVSLTFWQATWFLYIQAELSAADAILMYVLFDISTTVLEVPSGYLSDRIGRRPTLIFAAVCGVLSGVLQAIGGSFMMFAAGQVLLGAAMAFASGTDSALLYETLRSSGRENEIEAQEVKAWRFGFTGLAVSAVIGGVMAASDPRIPYWAVSVSYALVALLLLRMRESSSAAGRAEANWWPAASLRQSFSHPVLRWLLVLSLLMYAFSHIPFVFGQPFIDAALKPLGWSEQATIVSGAVTAVMMGLSVLVSLFAPAIREKIGLIPMLLGAFAMQIALAAVLALSNSFIVIAILFLRMVPDSLSKPFIVARIQPLLSDDSRAVYMSLQSFAGRILFAGTLYLASLYGPEEGALDYQSLRVVLTAYVAFGVVCFTGLILWSRHKKIGGLEDRPS